MTRTKQLMRENNAFERALSPEFNQVLTDMVVYLRSAPVSEYNQELVRRDIGRMFLDAQRRGDSPADVIGEDYRQFCDQVLAEVPRLTVRERVLDGLSTSLVCLGVWGVIWLFNRGLLAVVRGGWPDIPVTVGDLLVTVLILAAAGYLFYSVSRSAFSASSTSLLIKTFLLLAVLLLGQGKIMGSLELTLVAFVIVVVLALALELFLSSYLLYRYDHDEPVDGDGE